MKNIKKRIIELSDLLNHWNYEYYALDSPSIPDQVFDKHMQELIALEKKYPQLKMLDSPTQRVGGIVLSKFEKIKHQFLMLSLDNVFDNSGIIKFINNIDKNIKQYVSYVLEPKIDGLSISIIYENCKLKYALTRGDGQYGENVTSNVLTIESIPLFINERYKDKIIEVRGEVYMPLSSFNELNRNSDRQFANPRNAAAGALRNLDSSIAKSRNLSAFFYYVNSSQELDINTQEKTIEWLRTNNFLTAPIIKKVNDIEGIIEYIENISLLRNTLSYDIDGIVIKLNEMKYYEELGYTSKFPKFAIAYKFDATRVLTKLLDIKRDVGRTGKISYIAVLEPVNLNGSIISAASLHNYDFITKKDIHINDYLYIYKAGDVIPYVEEVELTKRDKTCVKYEVPITCPSCNSLLKQDVGFVDLFCLNKNCIEKNIHKIEYFASRDIMNIEGLSYAIIKKLFENNLIKNAWDLYDLHQYKDIILQLDLKIKDKLFDKLINAINLSKANSLERLIASFSIKNVGITTAKAIAKRFLNLDNLVNATLEQLNEINIIGDKISNGIFEFINDKNNQKIFARIKSLNINTLYIEEQFDGHFDLLQASLKKGNQIYHNKTFVITGTFSIPRERIKLILETFYNVKIQNTITKKTDYLLSGQDSGSKLDKASKFNIKIIEIEFWN